MREFLCLCLVLSFCEVVYSQPAPAKAEAASVRGCSAPYYEAITHISEHWKDGYNSGNADKVASLYAEDAYYLTQHFITGIVQGRPCIRAYVQRGVDAHYHVDSIRTLSMDCSGDFAYAITRYESTNAGQKAFGVNIVVLKKIHGKWLIVAHEAAVPDPGAIRQLDPPKAE
jgi:ketosteroid isomerase-like protein